MASPRSKNRLFHNERHRPDRFLERERRWCGFRGYSVTLTHPGHRSRGRVCDWGEGAGWGVAFFGGLLSASEQRSRSKKRGKDGSPAILPSPPTYSLGLSFSSSSSCAPPSSPDGSSTDRTSSPCGVGERRISTEPSRLSVTRSSSSSADRPGVGVEVEA